MRMPATGGVAEAVKGGDGVRMFPQVLPGVRAVLASGQRWRDQGLFNGPLVGMNYEGLDIGVLQFSTGQMKTRTANDG